VTEEKPGAGALLGFLLAFAALAIMLWV